MGTNIENVTDCRRVICSGQLGYAAASTLFRRFYKNYPRTDIHLLDYACEHAPSSLFLVVRILTEVSDCSRLLLPLMRLYDETRERRLRAQLALIIARHFRSWEWAIQAMTEPDARLRANVIEGTSDWNTDAALPLRALHDVHHRVVCNACVSLVKMGHPKGPLTLRLLLEHPAPEFRAAACWAYSVVGTAADAAAMEAMQSDPHPSVRTRAAKTLTTLKALVEREREPKKGTSHRVAV